MNGNSIARLRSWGRALAWLLATLVFIDALLPPGPLTQWDCGMLALLPVPCDKTLHALVFAALAALFAGVYLRRAAIVLGLAAYGGAIELCQALTPYRDAEAMDWLADLAGIGLGIAAISLALAAFPIARRLATAGEGS